MESKEGMKFRSVHFQPQPKDYDEQDEEEVEDESPRKKFEPDFSHHYFTKSTWDENEELEQFTSLCPTEAELRVFGQMPATDQIEPCSLDLGMNKLENLQLSPSLSPENSLPPEFSHDPKSPFHPPTHENLETIESQNDSQSSSEIPSPIFSKPVNSAPYLRSISFEHKNTELVVRALKLLVLSGGGDSAVLSHLTTLEISESQMDEDFIHFALKHRWSLENLKISFSPKVPLSQIHRFLTHLRTSLISLDICFQPDEEQDGRSGSETESKTRSDMSDNWLIPLCMKYLREIIIQISPVDSFCECRSLVNVLQLPALQTLTIEGGAGWTSGEFRKMWTDLEGRKWKKWAEPTVEILRVPLAPLLDESIFCREDNLWGNLKVLSCYSPTISVLKGIFQCGRTLERLEVNGLNGAEDLDWSEILTGGKDPVDFTTSLLYGTQLEEPVESGKCGKELQGASIRNLTNLKFLWLDFEASLPRRSELTDFFIYNGLVDLPKLEHVHINRHQFTEDAVRYLRGNIHPFAYLDFGWYSDEDFHTGFDRSGFKSTRSFQSSID